MKAGVVSCLLFFICSCNSSTKEKEQEVLALKEMSSLATVEYLVTKIIKASDNQSWYKIGDRKILMSCQASLKAGIDFSKINADKIKINGKEISLELPRAELLYLNIKPEDIKVEYEETGVFRNSYSADEKNMLMAQGEKQIKSSVDSLGILQTAETNASVFVSNFLRQLGYKKINISFSSIKPAVQLK